MSLGGTTGAKTEKTPNLTDFNLLPANTSQSAQDILIPYFAGINRIKTMWVSPALNIHTQEVKTSGGGGKGGQGNASSGQFKYFADFVSVIAMGPADRLINVIIDNTLAFNGSISNSGAEFVDVNLGQWGSMRLSWGNPNQGPPSSFPLRTADNRPLIYGGQRGKVRAEFRQLYFGSVGRTSIPTIELVIERYPDVPGFAHGSASIRRVGSGVSPIAVIYEIMTNVRYGLGLPASKFDIAQITIAINTLAARQVWISPLISSQQPVRSVIQDLCTYFDGFVRRVNGLIQISFYTHAGNNGAGAPALNFDSFLPPGVRFRPVGYAGTVNEVLMTSLNSTLYFTPNTLRAADTASRLITGVPRNVSIDRPYLVDPGVAKAYLEQFTRFNSNPFVTGSGDVKKEAMYSINVGDLVLIQSGDFGAQALCRITAKTWGSDTSGKCSIEFEQERATFDSAYSPAALYPDITPYVNPAQITKAFFAMLPTALRNAEELEIAILAERNSILDYGFVPWVSADNIIFDSTNKACSFAVRGTFVSNTVAKVHDTLDTVGFVVTMTGIDTNTIVNLTLNQCNANTTLLFVDKEIISLLGFTALGNNRYNVTGKRGIYGSIASAHTAGAQVWFINRRAIVPISWDPFASGTTYFFKLQTFTHFSVFDLSTASTFAFTLGSINASLAGPTNLVVGTDDTDVVFNWVLDPSPLVFGYEIRYGLVGGNWQQATIAYDGTKSAHSVTHIIPPGTWVFYVTSYDQFFNHSIGIATFTFTVPSLFHLVELNYGIPQHALDAGALVDYEFGNGNSTFTNCTVHPTAYVLVPISGNLASFIPAGGDGFSTFDQFCVSPPTTCTFISEVVDSLGSGTDIRSSIAVYEYLWGLSGIPPTGLDLVFSLPPAWSGATITNGVVHSTDYSVVPKSSRLASFVPGGGDGFETFDVFVLDPLTPTNISFTQDVGESVPLLATLTTGFDNGPAEPLSPVSSASISHSTDNVHFTLDATGSGTITETTIARYVKYQASLDNTSSVGTISQMTPDTLVGPTNYWVPINGQMRTSPDGVTFGPWVIVQSNFTSDRYVQYMVTWSPTGGIWPAGVSSIWMLLDAPSSVQTAISKSVSIGGTSFTFNPPFRTILPSVNVTIVGSVALFPIVTVQSLTGFTVKVFNQAGTDVGGIVNWTASGV